MENAKRESAGAAIGKIASGVLVVTAADGDRNTGVLVSWVQQVAFEPPMVMVAVKKGRPIEPLLDSGRCFALNILAEGDNALMKRFSRGYDVDEDAFAGLPTRAAATGCPILEDAMAFIDCNVVSVTEAGDHDIYVGEVVGGELLRPDAKPMVHVRKSGFSY
jgi:flavin reductase (DIM6/NTAB) family NADH-FMN oxidoreductase RutF